MTAPRNVPGKPLCSLDDAWEIIAVEVQPRSPIVVPLQEAAGRILAQPVHATTDWPPFDKAMMDGFAVRSVDCATPGARLQIAGLIAAGRDDAAALQPGEAFRINTGAPIPPGADCVIRIEDARVDKNETFVEIDTTGAPGKHMERAGAHRRAGDLLLAPPMTIEPAQLGALVTAGCRRVHVYPEVTVGIVTTGNELVPLGEVPGPGMIYDSNGPMLAALMRQFGAIPRDGGIARDEKDALRERLRDAMQCDIVVTVGGVSAGTLDLVPEILAEMGTSWRFHGVNIRPGKPVAYGSGPDGQHVFGLPGNPVSAFVCSWLFVRMAIRGLVGHPVKPPHRLRATLTRPIPPKRDPRPAFVPARFWNHSKAGELVEPCAWQGSGDPFGLAMANALLVIDDPTRGLEADECVEVIGISHEI